MIGQHYPQLLQRLPRECSKHKTKGIEDTMSNKSVSDFVAATMDAVLKSAEHKSLFGTQYKFASEDENDEKDKCSKCGKKHSGDDKCKCGDSMMADDKDSGDSSYADDNDAKKKKEKASKESDSSSSSSSDSSSADDGSSDEMKSSAAYDV